jgi:multicomponent K+:H+ antiporter subunit A
VKSPARQLDKDAYDDAREDRSIGDTLFDYLLVPRLLMQWLFPLIIVLASYLFVRGHDMPGGGFAAGIAVSIGLILQYMAVGVRKAETRLPVWPILWIGLGLLIALATGAGSWLFGYPFLTSSFDYLELPVLGAVPIASALLFDLGVFLVVVGATALILVALAHQSIRTPRAGRIAPVDPPTVRKD